MSKFKPQVDSVPVELVLRATDPCYTPNKSAVTFTVGLAKPGGTEIISIPGWRVWKGAVVPPSTRKKNGTFFPTVHLEPHVDKILTMMVSEWAKEFPMVRFPSTTVVLLGNKRSWDR